MTNDDEFDYRESLFLGGFFGNFVPSEFWCNEHNQLFFSSKLRYKKCYALDSIFDGGIQNCNCWGIQVWILSEMDDYSSFWNFRTGKTLMQGTQIDSCSIESFSTTKNFWIPTLMEEIRAVFSVKQEFEYREQLKLKGFLWNFRNNRILTQGRKTIIFQVDTFLVVLSFWLRSWWNQLNFWWLRFKNLNINRNKKISTIWNYWAVTNLLHRSKQKICLPQTESIRWRPWLEKS